MTHRVMISVTDGSSTGSRNHQANGRERVNNETSSKMSTPSGRFGNSRAKATRSRQRAQFSIVSKPPELGFQRDILRAASAYRAYPTVACGLQIWTWSECHWLSHELQPLISQFARRNRESPSYPTAATGQWEILTENHLVNNFVAVPTHTHIRPPKHPRHPRSIPAELTTHHRAIR